MSNQLTDLEFLLSRVGVVRLGDDLLVAPGLAARAYRSSYARLYIADCIDRSSGDWSEIVRATDRTVLEDVRRAEMLEGGVIDAHVCFIVSEAASAQRWGQANERALRNVSRKYWITSDDVLEQLKNRLPFLPISDPPELDREDHFKLSDEDAGWLEGLMAEGPGVAFSKFLASLEDV